MATIVTKEFTFDSAHQLVGHDGKCANVHGHTYRLEIALRGKVVDKEGHPKEGFVIDFSDLKKVAKDLIVDKLDHAFIAKGDEPALETLRENGSKVAVLGFRTTCENMSQYICWKLWQEGLPVHYVRLWETPTGSAISYIDELLDSGGPQYNTIGGCDLD